MENYLGNLWDQVEAKLGALTGLVAAAADQVKVKVAAGDVEGATKRLHEADEALDKAKALVSHMKAAVADGSLSGTEIAGGALLLQQLADEIEDVATGQDEDDPPPPVT